MARPKAARSSRAPAAAAPKKRTVARARPEPAPARIKATAKPKAQAEAPATESAPSAQRLQELAESLESTQSGLLDVLHHIPRSDEYEPLTAPLREFAKVSPSLVDALSALPRLSAVLSAATERLDRASERLATPPPPSPTEGMGVALLRLRDAAADLDDVRQGLLGALGTLPREEDYAPTARQLRELASVSPSLLEWLREVPKLSAPLAESISIFREAVERVASARTAILAALDALSAWPEAVAAARRRDPSA